MRVGGFQSTRTSLRLAVWTATFKPFDCWNICTVSRSTIHILYSFIHVAVFYQEYSWLSCFSREGFWVQTRVLNLCVCVPDDVHVKLILVGRTSTAWTRWLRPPCCTRVTSSSSSRRPTRPTAGISIPGFHRGLITHNSLTQYGNDRMVGYFTGTDWQLFHNLVQENRNQSGQQAH